MYISINYFAVVAAAISQMVLGFLWYGPVFGKQWMALSGHSQEKMKQQMKDKSMASLYATAFIGSLVMAYVLAHFAAVWGAMDVMGAFQLAFWTWLGFIATVLLGSVLWEGKPVTLYVLNAAYQLVSLVVMAVIIALWR